MVDTRFKKGIVPWNKDKKGLQVAWNKGKKTGKSSWMKGRKHTPESLLKMVEAQKKAWTNLELRKRMSKTSFKKGQTTWNKGKKGLQVAWNKGISPSGETKIKISEATKKAMSRPEVREKISNTSFKKGQTTWNKGKKGLQVAWNKDKKGLQVAWNKGKSPYEETKIKMSKTFFKKGQISWMKGKHLSEESKAILRESILKQYESGTFPRQTDTNIEILLKEELLKRGYKEGLDFIHQYKFMNKFMCDFCFPKEKVIVEADGDYWHCNPNIYPNPTHPRQVKNIGRDKSKKGYITKVDNNSWTILNFWGSEIEKDVSKCVDKIEEVLRIKREV